jgi:twitching motility two-component system response regulator PilH
MDKAPLVLLVDDEPNFLEILSIKLNTAGFRVEVAANGDLGVKKAKELHPDLILMDVQMPIKNGIDAVTELKSNPETKNLRVAFLTSLGDSRPEAFAIDEKFANDMGALGYLRKTDDLDNILSKVKEYLGR